MTEGRYLLSMVNCKFRKRNLPVLLFYRLDVLSQVNVTLSYLKILSMNVLIFRIYLKIANLFE